MTTRGWTLVVGVGAITLLTACATNDPDTGSNPSTATTLADDAEAAISEEEAATTTTLGTIAPVDDTGAGESSETSDDATKEDEDEDESDSMPDEEQQWYLRTQFEHTIGRGPGSIESELGYAPVLLEPGTYSTDSMYTPVTFTLDDTMRLVVERPTFMLLVDQSAPGLWDTPLMHWMRPRGLVDPSSTSNGPPEFPRMIDGWDFDAWFDAHPGIDVVASDVDIGGRAARYYDITYPSDTEAGWACGPSVRCIPIVMNYDGPFALRTTDPTRMWVIPQGDEAPIVIHAAIGPGQEWGDFGERLGPIIASAELGDPEPVAIPDNVWEAGLTTVVPAGTVEFPILGGVRFELLEDHFVAQDRNWSLIDLNGDWTFYAPNVEVAAALQAYDFTPIGSAEQLAELFIAEVGATRLDDEEMLGRPAVVIDVSGDPGVPMFRSVVLPDDAHPEVNVWYTQDYVRIWAIDTDDGVLIVTAEGATPDDLDAALVLHEQVRATLELL